MRFIKGLFAGLGIGIGAALASYAVGFVLELLNLLTCGILSCQCGACVGCGGIRACDNAIWSNVCYDITLCPDGIDGILPMWSGKIFLNIMIFCGIAGTIIGSIYGFASGAQERNIEKGERRKSVNSSNTVIKNVITKSDNIVSLIINSKKTIVSTGAKKILDEAAAESSKAAAALDRAATIAEKARGKSSKRATDNIKQAESAARQLEKDVDAAVALHNQVLKEEADWNRLQMEANNTANNAKNAVANTEKEVATIEKMNFISAAAKDAAVKAAHALSKAKNAAAETVNRADAAARSASALDVQTEVILAKHSEKRTLVEEKIAVEEAKIAIEAERNK